jgi:hypothetical protein
MKGRQKMPHALEKIKSQTQLRSCGIFAFRCIYNPLAVTKQVLAKQQ